MPTVTVSIPKNETFKFKVKVSQDGNVLTPPTTIPSSPGAGNIVGLTRQADEAGRAVFHISGLNVGTAQATVGSGSGTLTIDATVTAPAPGPVVFELDGIFEPV